MTLYLLDANVLIRADGDYYPLDRIPGFWSWLLEMAEAGRVKTPPKIYDEVAKSANQLGQWLRRPEVHKAIVLAEPTSGAAVAQVITEGYAPDLNDTEIESLGRDPFLVAAALGGFERIAVSREVSARSKRRHNRKVPDVCRVFIDPAWVILKMGGIASGRRHEACGHAQAAGRGAGLKALLSTAGGR